MLRLPSRLLDLQCLLEARAARPGLTGTLVLLAGLSAPLAHGHGAYVHEPADSQGRAIEFPDTLDHLTLTLDPHTHTVFSDGHVWPWIRVGEALRDDLDAYAVTEHLEYQPHRADIPHPDRLRSYEQALEASGDSDLLIISGSEITREQPVGHINAIFVTDPNALIRPPMDIAPEETVAYYLEAGKWPASEVLEIARAQGAFVFWNHPNWTRQRPDGIATPTDFHLAMFEQGLIQGIEVANGADYSEEAFAIALEHGLTIIGTSDVHNLIDWDYSPLAGGHRPVTLVLARERSIEGIREAMVAGRTLAWFKNLLIGRAEHVAPVLEAALTIAEIAYLPDTELLRVVLRNRSDARWQLMNRSSYTFMGEGDLIEVPPHGETVIDVKAGAGRDALALPFDVLNALVAPGTAASITLQARL